MSRAALLAVLSFTLLSPAMRAASITVDSLDDATGCSLRNAILAANTNVTVAGCAAGASGQDTITISVNGTYSPQSALPFVTEPIALTATYPNFTLDGLSAGAATSGLVLAPGSSGSSISGLIVTNFGASGILVRSSSNSVLRSRIGTNGETMAGNCRGASGAGIYILGAPPSDASFNVLGAPNAHNVISGNLCDGVRIEANGAQALGNRVVVNRIGTNNTSDVALPNSGFGVSIAGAARTVVGGALEPELDPFGDVCFGLCNHIAANTGGQIFANGVPLETTAGQKSLRIDNNVIGSNLSETQRMEVSAGAPTGRGITITNSLGPINITGYNAILGSTADGVYLENVTGPAWVNGRVGIGYNGASVPNEVGVLVRDSTGVIVNGNIAANRSHGVWLDGAQDTTVTASVGFRTSAIAPNGGSGIRISSSAARAATANAVNTSTVIVPGGAGIGRGVNVVSGTMNRVTQTLVWADGGLYETPIDLGGDGATANDACDPDGGANLLQNFPVISSATRVGDGRTRLIGTLASSADAPFTLELFNGADGQMREYLGSAAVNTVGCNGAFDVVLQKPTSTGSAVRATATNATSGTSEASPAVVVHRGQPVPKADFSGQQNDIVFRNVVTGQNAAWFMNGFSLIIVKDFPALPNTNYRIVGTADMNRDRTTDLVWRSEADGSTAAWLLNGGTEIAAVADMPKIPDTNWEIRGTGDFNADGDPDVVLRNRVSGANVIWLMNRFYVASVVDLPGLANANLTIAGIGDFTGDGRADILWRNQASGSNAIWKMEGTNLVSVLDLPALPNTDWYVGGVADMDNDANPDILWRNSQTGGNAAWRMSQTSLVQVVDLPSLPNLNWEMVGPK